MKLEEIDIFVDHEGIVRIEVRGVKGRQCMILTEETETLLGNSITTRETTSEFDERTDDEGVVPTVKLVH
jgi:hypothetical protein